MLKKIFYKTRAKKSLQKDSFAFRIGHVESFFALDRTSVKLSALYRARMRFARREVACVLLAFQRAARVRCRSCECVNSTHFPQNPILFTEIAAEAATRRTDGEGRERRDVSLGDSSPGGVYARVWCRVTVHVHA